MTTWSVEQSANHIRIGAAGALGAVTLMWLGKHDPMFFQAGTVLLTICLIPLASGMSARSGTILGMLFGMLWIAAHLGFVHRLDMAVLFSPLNLGVLGVLTVIGGVAGKSLGSGSWPPATTTNVVLPARSSAPSADKPPRPLEYGAFTAALARHREWAAEWDQVDAPWTSFDAHARELLRVMVGAQRVRCYRVSADGSLQRMSGEPGKETVLPPDDLLSHVVTLGRRYLAGAAVTGPFVEQLAENGPVRLAWAVPIRDGSLSIGLITAESFSGSPDESQLHFAADLIEELWRHVYHVDLLRIARLTDRGSGVINRTDFLGSLNSVLEQAYGSHEPVVVLVICLEGLRGLDDASEWQRRDELVEQVGQVIASGIRKDDVVGRFTDAQFVVLLRRLDVALAELICRKLMSTLARVISESELARWITPRAGLSASGFEHTPAEVLLRHAIAALQEARTQDILLVAHRQDTAREQPSI